MTDFSYSQETAPASPQIVPQSREAEEAVIGAVLINPEAYYDVAQFLRADDFYIHRHRWIWETFVRLREQRKPIDFDFDEVLAKRAAFAERRLASESILRGDSRTTVSKLEIPPPPELQRPRAETTVRKDTLGQRRSDGD